MSDSYFEFVKLYKREFPQISAEQVQVAWRERGYVPPTQRVSPSGLTFSVLQTENFAIYYPNGFNENVITAVAWLSDLLTQSEFVSTFNLSGHDVLKTITSNKFRIRVISPQEYNNDIRSFAHNDSFVNTEYGWYDASICPRTVYINQDYYRSNQSTNLKHLQTLAIVTAIHELQHFLIHHLDLTCPNQPIPSLRPPTTEAGDYWEFHNLGGRLGIVSTKENPDFLIDLYLTGLDDMNQEFETLVSSTTIEEVITGASCGKNVFPKSVEVMNLFPQRI